MKRYNQLMSTALWASLASGSVIDLISRAPPPVYNVYPKNRTDIANEKNINNTLKGYGVDLSKIYFAKSTIASLGVFYWEAPITSQQASQLNKSSDVAGVYASCKNTNKCTDPVEAPGATKYWPFNKRDDGLTQQQPLPAPDEMVFISQARGAALNDLGGKYVYDKSAGKDAIVYVVDTGAYLDNTEFTNGANVRAKTTWLFSRPDLANRMEDYTLGHGTCMLSKVTGDQFGVSKNISPIVVKIPSTGERGNGNLDWINGVRLVLEDYSAKLAAGADETVGAIVSMSFQLAKLDPPAVSFFKVILQGLVDVNVLPITGAGNGGPAPITGHPAAFASSSILIPADVPELMVIGNCDNTGARWITSQSAPYVRLYAPGREINCAATPELGGGSRLSTGTSDSAASVAGLAAYFKKLTSLKHTLKMDDPTAFSSDRVKALKDYIESVSYPAAAKPPYAQGTCHIHVNEIQNCASDNENLSVEITMRDDAGTQIGYVPLTEAGVDDPLSMKSKLESPLVVLPEHQNDYIQFTLGIEAWPSSQNQQTNSQVYCNVGGWDPREGPVCGRFPRNAKRQMDCYFQCPYHGGKSSDGS